MAKNLSATSICGYVVTFKSIIKYLVRKDYNCLTKEDKEIFIHSGRDIESLPIVNILHGYCSATRAKLSVVPEPISTLVERNSWEEWEDFNNTLIKGS